MKNIVLLCSAGMSTSMLVKNMREAAKAEGYDCEINAYGLSEAKSKGANADVILLGPQVRFQLKEISAQCPNVPIDSIDMLVYGTMDGKKALAQAKQLMGD